MSDDRFDKIEAKLDKIDEHLGEYNKQLAIHIAGVQQNRTSIDKMDGELEYVTTHVHEVQGGIKLLKIVGITLSVLAGSLGLLKGLGVI